MKIANVLILTNFFLLFLQFDLIQSSTESHMKEKVRENENLKKNYIKRTVSNEFMNNIQSYISNNKIDSVKIDGSKVKMKLEYPKNKNNLRKLKALSTVNSTRETFKNLNSFNNLVRNRLSSLSSLTQNYEDLINFQIQKELVEIKEILNSKIKSNSKREVINKKLESLNNVLSDFLKTAESSLINIKGNLDEKIKSISENLSFLLNSS